MTDSIGRRRKLAILVALFSALGIAVSSLGVLLAAQLKSPDQAAADALPPSPSVITAEVEMRVLSEAVLIRGEVVAGKAKLVGVPPGLAGDTAIVTNVPVKRGAKLNEGRVILEVAGEPVFALRTRFPFYRDIIDGFSGPDVRELQGALRRLGYKPQVNGVFDDQTQEALSRFYAAAGYDVPVSPPPSGDTVAKPFLRRMHVVRIERVGQIVTGIPVKVGDALKSDDVILELDAGPSSVTGILAADQLPVIVKGTEAEVIDEIRGDSAKVVVSSISSDPTETNLGTGFLVEMGFVGRTMEPTPNHTVRVSFHVGVGLKPVVAVPVTAVFSRPDGTTYIVIVTGDAAAPLDAMSNVEVRTAESAGGWVAIESVDADMPVKPGDVVVVGYSR